MLSLGYKTAASLQATPEQSNKSLFHNIVHYNAYSLKILPGSSVSHLNNSNKATVLAKRYFYFPVDIYTWASDRTSF